MLCAAPLPCLAAVLAILVALHPVLIPTTATWLQVAEREGENEAPASEESSPEIAPGLISAATARTRRTAGAGLAIREPGADGTGNSIQARRANGAVQPAEIAGRNGSGGPLRC